MKTITEKEVEKVAETEMHPAAYSYEDKAHWIMGALWAIKEMEKRNGIIKTKTKTI